MVPCNLGEISNFHLKHHCSEIISFGDRIHLDVKKNWSLWPRKEFTIPITCYYVRGTWKFPSSFVFCLGNLLIIFICFPTSLLLFKGKWWFDNLTLGFPRGEKHNNKLPLVCQLKWNSGKLLNFIADFFFSFSKAVFTRREGNPSPRVTLARGLP